MWFPVQVSQGVARVPVLPRRIAAGVTVFAVARSGWAIAAVTLLATIVGIAELLIREGDGSDAIAPVSALVVMLAALLVLAIRPSVWSLVAYIVVSSICVYLYLHGIMDAHSSLLPAALVLVNRPASALVLVGTVGSRPLPAVLFGLVGFLAGEGMTLIVSLQDHVQVEFGNGPAITLANYCAAYLGLSLIQRAQRGRVPDFLRLRQETRRIEAARTIEQRAVAVLHDTILNDLAFVINGPDKLDARMRDRMLLDVATLANSDVLDGIESSEFVDESDASLRNQAMLLVSDFQWRGLNVEVTGDTGTVAHMTPEAVAAAVGALRACLENVLRHSGVTSAEIIVSVTDTSVTWTVNDSGRGFDPKNIDADRLGLRTSVFTRVESAGGTVKIFSAPGSGASVLFTLPLLPAATTTPASTDA
jgi:signal transduction histidine kinase